MKECAIVTEEITALDEACATLVREKVLRRYPYE